MKQEEEKVASKEFDEWAKKGFASSMESGHFPVAKIAIDKIKIKNSDTILDLSCGNGWGLKYFLQKGAYGGIGADISSEMIKKAVYNLKDFNKKLLLISSVKLLPFKNESFNIVFNMESFYYYKNPGTVLKEIYRIIKKGGVFLLLADYYKENRISMRWSERLNIYMNPMNIDEYKKILSDNGFKVLSVERIKSPDIKNEKEFKPSDSIKTYEEYLEFKQSGTLSITAVK